MRSLAPLLVLLAGLSLAAGVRAQGEEEPPPEPEAPAEPDSDAAEEEAGNIHPEMDPSAGLTVPRTSCHGRVVRSISVEGARRVDAADVISATHLREGAVCNDDDIARDARALWALDFFDNIVIEANRQGDQVDLVITVSERPAIARIEFEGNDEVSDEDLDEEVSLTTGTILSIPDLREQLGKIRDKYAEEGFFLAQVDYELRPVDGEHNEVAVVFRVREGAEVTVRTIRFVGNEQIPSDELMGIMRTNEQNILSFISSRHRFNRQHFEEDLTRIQAYYYDKGYLTIALGDSRVELSPDRRHIDIVIPIIEGPRFRVGRIDVTEVDHEGNEVDPLVGRERLQTGIGVESGEWFSRSAIAEGLQEITREYRDAGFANAQLNPETNVDSERRIVDLNVSIERGPIVYVERINIRGNTKTRDQVIRREMMLFEGMQYHQSLLERSKTNLTALGYFERVDVSEEAGSAPGLVVLNVEVAERPTGTFQVGAGFSSLEQFILTAQIDQQNLFGRGQSLSLQVQLSAIRQLAQVSFVEPWFLGSMWSLGADAFKTVRQYAAFSRDSTGFGVNFGHPIYDRRLRFNVGYRLEYVKIGSSNRGFYGPNQAQAYRAFQQSPLANRFLSGLTSTLRMSFTWDSRNNRMQPTQGIYAAYTAELADNWLGSQNVYFRQNAFFRFYRRIWGPFVFRANAEAGLVTSRLGKGVPIYERYYLGGIYNVRGYYYNSLGPRALIPPGTDPDPTAIAPNGVALGGNLQAFYQLEVEFAILQSAGIRGVVFTDGGNVWNLEQAIAQAPSTGDPTQSPAVRFFGPIRTSVGFGLRWFSPMGPLRFEWGWPLARRPGEQPVQFQFTIGNSF